MSSNINSNNEQKKNFTKGLYIKLLSVGLTLCFLGAIIILSSYLVPFDLLIDPLSSTLFTITRFVGFLVFTLGIGIFLFLLFEMLIRFGSSSFEGNSLVESLGYFFGAFTINSLNAGIKLGATGLEASVVSARIDDSSVTLPSLVDKLLESSTDPRKTLVLSWERLNVEEKRLASRSILTLSAGLVFTAVAVGFLIYFTLQLDKIDTQSNPDGYFLFLAPRLSGVLIIQVLAGFFLKMYVASENAISTNKAEITNIEMRLAALGLVTSAANKFELAKIFALEERLAFLSANLNSNKDTSSQTEVLKILAGKIGSK
ncbi:MAG: hypothetical protein ABJN69_17090 [Hellea sp.]